MTFTLIERGEKTQKHTLQVLYDCRVCSSLHFDFFFSALKFLDQRWTSNKYVFWIPARYKEKKLKVAIRSFVFFFFFFLLYTPLSDLLASQKEHNSCNKCYDNTPLRRGIENVDVFYVCTKCKGLLFCTALRETHCIWYCAWLPCHVSPLWIPFLFGEEVAGRLCDPTHAEFKTAWSDVKHN